MWHSGEYLAPAKLGLVGNLIGITVLSYSVVRRRSRRAWPCRLPGNDGCRHRVERGHTAADPAGNGQPQESGGLVGQAITISDRDRRPAHNRLIEIDARQAHRLGIPSPDLVLYRGNEDVNFSEDGKQLAVSEEDNYDVHIVDYEKKAITWTYGTPITRAATRDSDYPDDAHLLPTATFSPPISATTCVLIIDPRTSKIVTQWGTAGKRNHNPPHELAAPTAPRRSQRRRADSEIGGSWITRITRDSKVLWSVQAPHVNYPSDAFPTVNGKHVIVADFWKPVAW